MAHLEQEPFFTMAKAWDADDYSPAKQKFSKTTTAGRTIKGEVTPDDSERTTEFTIACTVAEFEEVRRIFQWDNSELFAAFRKCLTGQARTTWDEKQSTIITPMIWIKLRSTLTSQSLSSTGNF